jgi:hypothetical protein
MYLKYIRQERMYPLRQVRRGTLYRVHFQPNEKGGYNETQTIIGSAYEIGSAPALIYPVGMRQREGRLCVSFGLGARRSMLHLIDCAARETFFEALRTVFAQREEVRIEVV